MSAYLYKGYKISNVGYHQPDHCVWWEAVDKDGCACFHGHTLREVEMLINDSEWEDKLKVYDAEIERCRDELRATRERRDECETKMRTALERVTRSESKCDTLRKLVKELADSVANPPLCDDCDESCENRNECVILKRRELLARAREAIGGGK